MEVPITVMRSKIASQFDFPNWGNQEGAPREYLSSISSNGFANPWIPAGRQAWNNPHELSLIARKLLSNEDFAEVRAAKVSDLEGVEVPSGKFWLESPILTFEDYATRCCLRYVDDGEIKSLDKFSNLAQKKQSLQILESLIIIGWAG